MSALMESEVVVSSTELCPWYVSSSGYEVWSRRNCFDRTEVDGSPINFFIASSGLSSCWLLWSESRWYRGSSPLVWTLVPRPERRTQRSPVEWDLFRRTSEFSKSSASSKAKPAKHEMCHNYFFIDNFYWFTNTKKEGNTIKINTIEKNIAKVL